MSINVTEPYLPPLEKYLEYLKTIWSNKTLTNTGPLVQSLEAKLATFFNTNRVLFTSNGTVALQLAIKALNLTGEIITTPFSYAATTSAIIWEGCTAVFADIKPDTLTINPYEVEKKITKNTQAILATHVYGIPCDTELLENIANKYNLKIIYDAAHAFAVQYKGQSLVKFGDISIMSFHATKLFHTIEGGATISSDTTLMDRMVRMHNFGQKAKDEFYEVGINAKNSEFHAAMGLCNLENIEAIIKKRYIIAKQYDDILLENNILKKPTIPEYTEYNFAYYPIIFPSQEILLRVMNELKQENIYPRRYFYPSLTKLNYTHGHAKVAEDISQRILCLPMYDSLSPQTIRKIANLILKTI
ncbi:UDP-4-amino-4-deoxy-L-arabinose--oxoglutarate aminotransferase [Rickettsiales bacterium Ac37b]|nr:UDP-4-amino-4-deoxy-L-arabinose--oxoglutarate aminotransferase [Rickettsiales bacterium Ac37b]